MIETGTRREATRSMLSVYLERIWDRLYDTAVIPPGPFRRVQLFINPVGTYVNGKQRHWPDTNMVMAGCLPAPQIFVVRRLHLEILAASESDLSEMKRLATVRFQINCKKYFESPFHTLILEDWLRKAVSEIGANQAKEIGPYLDAALFNGNLALTAIDQNDIVIESQQGFRVAVEAAEDITLLKPFVFRFYLEGPEFRAVQ